MWPERFARGMSLVRAEGVSKVFGPRRLLDGVDLAIEAGDALLLRGRSGSGKSTLLHLLAGMDVPTEGRIVVDGRDLGSLDEEELAAWRLASVGYVFQHFNLIPDLTAEENVRLPMTLAKRKDARERSLALLEEVGLAARAGASATRLSGGEMQRVAIARALANEPRLILADEPTANLDEENARAVLALLSRLAVAGRAVVVASHDPLAAEFFARPLEIRDGRLVQLAVGEPA